MKLMELVGGLMLLVGGLSGLSMFGLQGLHTTQGTQAVQTMRVDSFKKAVQATQGVEAEKKQTNLQRELSIILCL
jgi:hypothetical protein